MAALLLAVNSIEGVHTALGVISPIQGLPTQDVSWPLKITLITTLRRKLKHLKHPSEGYNQYIRTNTKQCLISIIQFPLLKRMEEYFVIPVAVEFIQREITHNHNGT